VSLLELQDVHVHYGGIHALKGISIAVDEGGIATLVGANGAGKSTTLRAISGLIQPSRGEIRFGAKPLRGMKAHEIVRAGISHVPEGRIVFANLTVMDNLEMGAYLRRDRAQISADLKKIFQLFPRLDERRRQSAGTLSGGEQQMLAIARALMSRPRLLLMDEPSLGLAPKVVQFLFDLVRQIRERGISILMAEQNARQALRVSDYAYLLEVGQIRGGGSAREMEASEEVRRVYLGG
jgi:branched-chain amino acid transport system ATP-binding protein